MRRERKRAEYRRLLENLRAVARGEEKDWAEEDWRRALRRATAGEPDMPPPELRPRPAWVWAYAAVIIVLLGAAAIAGRSFFRAAWPTLAAKVEAARSAGPAPSGGRAGLAAQDQLSVTLVSVESGLRVYWYFDKEFDWKEENL